MLGIKYFAKHLKEIVNQENKKKKNLTLEDLLKCILVELSFEMYISSKRSSKHAT